MIRSFVEFVETVFSSVQVVKKQKVSTFGVPTIIGFDEWFPEALEQRNSVNVLQMKAFPPLAQKRREYDSILIRSSYNKIYERMLQNIRISLAA